MNCQEHCECVLRSLLRGYMLDPQCAKDSERVALTTSHRTAASLGKVISQLAAGTYVVPSTQRTLRPLGSAPLMWALTALWEDYLGSMIPVDVVGYSDADSADVTAPRDAQQAVQWMRKFFGLVKVLQASAVLSLKLLRVSLSRSLRGAMIHCSEVSKIVLASCGVEAASSGPSLLVPATREVALVVSIGAALNCKLVSFTDVCHEHCRGCTCLGFSAVAETRVEMLRVRVDCSPLVWSLPSEDGTGTIDGAACTNTVRHDDSSCCAGLTQQPCVVLLRAAICVLRLAHPSSDAQLPPCLAEAVTGSAADPRCSNAYGLHCVLSVAWNALSCAFVELGDQLRNVAR